MVTVALETRGWDEARSWIERARPEHPALLDQAHLLDELYGIVNVPSGVWIDESGTIVRPPEAAFPGHPPFSGRPIPEDIDPYYAEVIREANRIRVEPDKYVAAVRDWAQRGAASRFALSPEEVVRRSRERSPEAARAAAEFELGQHLARAGQLEDAMAHFRSARRLQPENWTYKRQAWSLLNRYQAPSELMEGDWLSDVRAIGAENYYEPLDM